MDKDLEKEFVPYELALRLKELGFDKNCLEYYDSETKYFCDIMKEVPAPLFSQVFRWFRDKYNLRGFIGFRPNVKKFDCHIYDMSLSGMEYVKQRTMEEFNKDPKVGTYEEAELACLNKLIKIVESKKE